MMSNLARGTSQGRCPASRCQAPKWQSQGPFIFVSLILTILALAGCSPVALPSVRVESATAGVKGIKYAAQTLDVDSAYQELASALDVSVSLAYMESVYWGSDFLENVSNPERQGMLAARAISPAKWSQIAGTGLNVKLGGEYPSAVFVDYETLRAYAQMLNSQFVSLYPSTRGDTGFQRFRVGIEQVLQNGYRIVDCAGSTGITFQPSARDVFVEYASGYWDSLTWAAAIHSLSNPCTTEGVSYWLPLGQVNSFALFPFDDLHFARPFRDMLYSIDEMQAADNWGAATPMATKESFLRQKIPALSPLIGFEAKSQVATESAIWAHNDSTSSSWVLSRSAPSAGPPLKLSSAFPQFSPNGDGTFDGAQLTVNAPPSFPWRIVIPELGSSEIGEGEGWGSYPWDGRVNGQAVPDGTYTLRLENADPTQPAVPSEVQVTIDTTKPKMKFMVNGSILKPDGTIIIDDVCPEFRVQLSDDSSGYDGLNAIRLEFSERPDGVTPLTGDHLSFDPFSRTYKYRVPVEDATILYLGDQWIRVTAYDRAGNKSVRTVRFAVGAHDRADKSVQFVSTPVVDTPPADYVPRGLNLEGKRVVRADARHLFFRTNPPGLTPAVRVLVIGSAATVGGLTFVFYDEIVSSIKQKLTKGLIFEIYSEPFGGNVRLTNSQAPHVLRHKEISRSILEEAILKTNEGTSDPRFEIWKENRVNPKKSLLVYLHTDGNIYQIAIDVKDGKPTIWTAFGSGVWKNYPTPPSRTEQWSGVIRQTTVVQKSSNPSGLWEADNPDPTINGDVQPVYRRHNWGVIPDDKLKPYFVSAGIGVPLKDRRIVRVDEVWR